MYIIEFIKSNISWIKDLFTILLTGTATTIAILTYIRAKATILQPMRTEVIKTQVKEITDILDFISRHDFSSKNLFDYYDLLRINLDVHLHDLKTSDTSSKFREELEEKIGGWVIFSEKAESKFVYVNGSYSDFINTLSLVGGSTVHNIIDYEINKLNVIFFTKTYLESYKIISKYVENPLLPKDMIKLLMKIKYDGKINLLLNLEESIINFCNQYRSLVKTNNLNYETESTLNRKIYYEFEQKRFKHDSDVLLLKGCIRLYLRIDDKWG